jgi:hypothetical protein
MRRDCRELPGRDLRIALFATPDIEPLCQVTPQLVCHSVGDVLVLLGLNVYGRLGGCVENIWSKPASCRVNERAHRCLWRRASLHPDSTRYAATPPTSLARPPSSVVSSTAPMPSETTPLKRTATCPSRCRTARCSGPGCARLLNAITFGRLEIATEVERLHAGLEPLRR